VAITATFLRVGDEREWGKCHDVDRRWQGGLVGGTTDNGISTWDLGMALKFPTIFHLLRKHSTRSCQTTLQHPGSDEHDLWGVSWRGMVLSWARTLLGECESSKFIGELSLGVVGNETQL
jgi:hypothetical protein